MKELANIVQHLTSADPGPAVLATLVTVEGSSYRRPGARMLVTANGSRIGSISGGCLEEDVLVRARAVAASGRAEVVIYDTTSENDLVWGVGLGCHGIVQVLLEKISARPAWATALAENLSARRPTELVSVWHGTAHFPLGTQLSGDISTPPTEVRCFHETIQPPPALTVFGAGDDALPLVRLAKELGWQVTVADPRPAFATRERFPLADRCLHAPAGELVRHVAPETGALAVVMTHHYVHDVPIVRDLLPRPLTYLGLLGPKKRAGKILGDLAAQGLSITAESRERLHAPVGLDLGAETPEEVALAILAEMQAVLAGRDARPLRERQQPIHG